MNYRPILVLILAVMLMTAGTVYAGGGALYRNGPDDNVSTEALVSTAVGSVKAPSNIGTGNRLLGYTFVSITGGSVGVYDATEANAMAGTGLIWEDGVVAGDSHTVWFPFPKSITTGIQAIFSVADGVLTLFYE